MSNNTKKVTSSFPFKSVSIKKLVETLNADMKKRVVKEGEKAPQTISYTSFSRAMITPIPGAVFDPETVNIEAVDALLKRFGVLEGVAYLDTLNPADLVPEKVTRDINLVIGDTWTHRNYTTEQTDSDGKPLTHLVNDEERVLTTRNELTIMCFTEKDVCVKDEKNGTLHAMQIKTFRQGAPEFVRGQAQTTQDITEG